LILKSGVQYNKSEMKRYRLTDHAKKRMKERGISVRYLESTLSHPDIVQPSFGNRKILVKFVRNKRLEVVAVEEDKGIIILTIYYAH